MLLWSTVDPTHLAGRLDINIHPVAVLTAVSYRFGGGVALVHACGVGPNCLRRRRRHARRRRDRRRGERLLPFPAVECVAPIPRERSVRLGARTAQPSTHVAYSANSLPYSAVFFKKTTTDRILRILEFL